MSFVDFTTGTWWYECSCYVCAGELSAEVGHDLVRGPFPYMLGVSILEYEVWYLP